MFRLQGALPERYVNATLDELGVWIGAAKAALGSRLLILGHHYQRDEVMRWADARGDSFGLSRTAADRRDADYIVFCGVHFMAEAADILTGPDQRVILPDLNAGCSMADMADIDAVEDAWESLATVTDVERIDVPFVFEFADPEVYARALASTGPAFEAIEAVGEASFIQAAVELAREKVRAGLPLRAPIAVVGYLARKPASRPAAGNRHAATP